VNIENLPPWPEHITRDGAYRVYKGERYTAFDDGNSADTAYYRDMCEALRARLALAVEALGDIEDWCRHECRTAQADAIAAKLAACREPGGKA
jgi:hypothetical protein